MSTLTERLRAAREVSFIVGDVILFGKSATVEDLLLMQQGQLSDAEICRRFVTNWQNVRESDLIDGGTDDIVEFDKDLFNEVIADKPEWWPFAQTIIIASANRLNARLASEKKIDGVAGARKSKR